MASTAAEREAIFALRYRAYLREGAISANPARALEDSYDSTPNALLFSVLIDSLLVGSIRIHVATQAHPYSPALETFSDLLAADLSLGKIILDPNRFVADHRASRHYPELPFVILRLPMLASHHFSADLATATVRLEHQAFYRRYLRYSVACAPRHYPTLIKPLALMTADFKREAPLVEQRYAFLREEPGEMISIFGGAFSVHSANPAPRPSGPM